MIQNLSCIVPSDNSGIWIVKQIHVFNRNKLVALEGVFSVGSPNYYNYVFNKSKLSNLLHRGSVTSSITNYNLTSGASITTLRRRLTPFGSRTVGYIARSVRSSRAIASFLQIL